MRTYLVGMTSPDRPAANDTDDAFAEWYRVARPQLLAALVAYCGDVTEAAEVVDEAFVRALARWGRVREMRSPSGWVFVVARNLLRRRATRRLIEISRVRHRAGGSSFASPDASDAVVAATEVAALLAILTPRQREVVVLHHGLDIAQDDVGALLGISRSSVASALSDARSRLDSLAKGDSHVRHA